MSGRRRVVVTGLGLVTACGLGWRAFWEKARAGESSLKPFREPFPGSHPARLTGQIENFTPGDLIRQKKSLKVMSRDIQLAVAASSLAVQDADLKPESLNLDHCGISMGAGAPINTDLEALSAGVLKAYQDGEFSMELFGREGIPALFPLWFLKDIPNMPACHVSIAHGFRGPNNTLTTSAASGLQAVGEAARVIERGDADCMLAGGTDSETNPLGLSRLEMLGLLSRDTGVRAPFSGGDSGLYLGEGAGILVLEGLDHALARGARIYAEVAGYGSSADADTDPVNPVDCGARSRAMLSALRDAGLPLDQISAVVACGASIPSHDRMEVSALESFGTSLPPVTAMKSVAGHLMAAAGALDAAFACAALSERFLPAAPGQNAEQPLLKLSEARALPEAGASILVNAFSLSGQSVSVVFRQFEKGGA